MVDHPEKSGFVIGHFLILNETNVLSLLFARRLREEKRFGEEIITILCWLLLRLIDIFVLFRTEDNGIGSEGLLSVDSF